MTVTLEKKTASELIKFKLQHVQETIQSILDKWNEENIDEFVQKARTGELSEAEMDAITIRQLVLDHKRLQELLDSVNSDGVQ
jgi:hypothetical protein